MSPKWLPLLIAPALLAITCGGDGSTPTPSPSPSPAVVLPSPTETPTATPSPTATPAPRPSPTVTPTTTPAVTVTPTALPPGAKIFFLSSRKPLGSWLMDADGSNFKRLGGLLEVREADIWSPDGSKVAFVRCPDDHAAGLKSEFIVANADGSEEVNISNHPASDISICYSDAPRGGFDWSPDGSRLVFYSYRDPSGLYVVNADGSGLAFLVEGTLPNWSPRGEVIAFMGGADEENGTRDLEEIRPDGSDRTLLARIPCSETALWSNPCIGASAIHWSPDGTLLTFSAGPLFSNAIFTLRADGSGLTQVTHSTEGEFGPTWDALPAWVDCTRPTAGCEARVTNVAPVRLNHRQEPGLDAPLFGKLGDGELVCFVGPPRFVDGIRWWPARTEAGIDGWSAAFDPAEPDELWLTATGRYC